MPYQDELKLQLDEKTTAVVHTLPDFCKKYFNSLKASGMSPRTRLQYAYDMKRFFDYLAGLSCFEHADLHLSTASDVLDPLTIEDIQEYFETLETYETVNAFGETETKLSSPAARARKVSSLRSFFKYYFRIGEIKNNLSDLMDVPKIPDKAIAVMTKDSVERILAAVAAPEGLSPGEKKRHNKIQARDYAILMTFFGTGLRVSELVGTDVKDVDFIENSIRVVRKGGDEDLVYFGPEVRDALEDYLVSARATLLAGEAEPALFLSMQHRRMNVRSVELMIKGYAEKAGLNRKVTPHTLRRTFGTNLYEETGDIYLVADALHHASVETTKRHYARMSKDHKKIAAEKSSTLFEK